MTPEETRLREALSRAEHVESVGLMIKSADLTAVLSEMERLRGERDDARQGERNASEHVRRVAADANEAFAAAEALDEFWDACGHPGNRGTLTPAEQAASLIRECDAAAALADQHRARAERLAGALRRVEPYLDAIVCYASTMDEHEPNRIAFEARQALAQEGEG